MIPMPPSRTLMELMRRAIGSGSQGSQIWWCPRDERTGQHYKCRSNESPLELVYGVRAFEVLLGDRSLYALSLDVAVFRSRGLDGGKDLLLRVVDI